MDSETALGLLRAGQTIRLESPPKKKFYECRVEGTETHERSGELETNGRRKVTKYATAEEALKAGADEVDYKGRTRYYTAEQIEEMNAPEEEEELEPSDPNSPRILDLRDPEGPLLGRLRGTKDRHEIRGNDDPDFDRFEATDPHFMLQRSAPAKWPDVLGNAEGQLVVSDRLRTRILAQLPKTKTLPVRILDVAGNEAVKGYHLVVVGTVAGALSANGSGIWEVSRSEPLKQLRWEDVPEEPLFWTERTPFIGASAKFVAKLDLGSLVGVSFVLPDDWSGLAYPEPMSTEYVLLETQTEGPKLVLDADYNDETDLSKPLAPTWPKNATAEMDGLKSRKKMPDLSFASPVLVASDKAKKILEKFAGPGELEFLPLKIKDHAKKPYPGEFWGVNVMAHRPFMDVAESNIEHLYGLIWSVNEISVDPSQPEDRPALFQQVGARFMWLFLRKDVVEALEKAKITGFRVTPIENEEYGPSSPNGVPYMSR